MGLLDRITRLAPGLFGSGLRKEAANLPPLPDPKVKGGAAAVPSNVRRSSTKQTQTLQESDRRVATTDLMTFRAGASTKEVVRNLAATSPDVSAAVNAYIRLAVTKDFSAIARNQDGTPNPEATNAVQQLINRFNTLGDYSDGFSGMNSLHSVAESMTKELRMYGSCSMELVLDKARLPARLQPISTTQIVFVDDGKNYIYPEQRVSGGGSNINLDIPTFFYESLDQDLLEAYSVSPMEAAVQPTLADTDFSNDIRRVIKRALHPRQTARILYDNFKKSLPMDILSDPAKLKEYQDAFISDIQTAMEGLEPDDVLVHFDNLAFEYMSRGNESLEREYATLQTILDGKMSSGTKVPGAVLGHGAGSQNIASTETLLFLKYAQGTQLKLNSIFSRALTLAARLLGYDVYVQFSFGEIDLRPTLELEAFKQMKQERVLTQLSIGLISDEEASIELFGRLPAPGAAKLSGTFFKAGATSPAGNPYSPTGATSSTQSTFNKSTNPDTPGQAKGPAATVVSLRAV